MASSPSVYSVYVFSLARSLQEESRRAKDRKEAIFCCFWAALTAHNTNAWEGQHRWPDAWPLLTWQGWPGACGWLRRGLSGATPQVSCGRKSSRRPSPPWKRSSCLSWVCGLSLSLQAFMAPSCLRIEGRLLGEPFSPLSSAFYQLY